MLAAGRLVALWRLQGVGVSRYGCYSPGAIDALSASAVQLLYTCICSSAAGLAGCAALCLAAVYGRLQHLLNKAEALRWMVFALPARPAFMFGSQPASVILFLTKISRLCRHPVAGMRRRPGQPPAVAAAERRHVRAPPAGCGGRDDRHKRPGRCGVPGRAAGHHARRQRHRRAVRGWHGCSSRTPSMRC